MHLQSVIELCKDTSLLGLKLLDMAHKLLGHSYGEKRNRKFHFLKKLLMSQRFVKKNIRLLFQSSH